MSAIVISQKENETHKFTFEHRRGRTLLTSQEHNTKEEVYETIDFLKNNFTAVETIRFKTPSGKFYFKIVYEGHTYGTSRRFNTELRFENGIEEVEQNFVKSETLDLSLDVFGDFPDDV